MNPTHRIALEARSGIWLMFYETLITNSLRRLPEGSYEQQLLRIFGHSIESEFRFDFAEKTALFVISDRKINAPLIVRDNSQRNVMLREE